MNNPVLVSPAPEDLDQQPASPRPSKMTSMADRQQLRFDTDQVVSWQQKLTGLLHLIKIREREIELMPFWRGLSAPFAVVSAVLLVLVSLLSGLAVFNALPSQARIPFQYNSIEERWDQTDKSVLLLLPIVFGMVNAIVIRLIFEIYKYDHRLSRMMGWILTVVNLLFLISISEIFSLIRAS